MKNKSLLILLAILIADSVQAIDLKVMTWNIRYNNPGDGENAWPLRKDHVIDLILDRAPDVFGLQEALLGQVNDIASRLPGYDWVGVGRDNGINAGEYSPIFYDSRRFQLKEQGWFWLSETPGVPSKGWDAAFPRICTYIKLEEYDSRRNFWVFNTHFDHVGEEARKEAAKLIFDKMKELNEDKLPVILTGDFNLTPDADPMKWLMRKMHDTRDMSEAAPEGPEGTFNGFDFNSPLEKRIDYIFVNRKVETVRKYSVLKDSYDQKYPSDHLPVFVEIWFK
ncbi:endonuclease/exonuclease/phosphatase family protein [Mangrovibacterium diazotrophicum]|uniref:Endonuclease/exonuclease/phosphatase family metal-dependent hydrolase n=1 Tax=Mangrovibacterium diazotrophicum TaxID=1261403 RepID=A0A419VWC1_9BACT|nr:endonuclease/exonuclease/phosphatase family protein [Mangrovibacterium diazotrophicum]RKD86450.1 endonuclease/exonuclease/phosphatase family metal-dependent hydrolase [Mangrovibacterium diazotrophicum]